MLDITTIRRDFPQYKDADYHFLDSAASSLTPTQVIEAMNAYYINDKSNVHRGLYGAAVRATERYEQVRSKVAQFIGADTNEIIFTSGATEAMNMLVRSIEASLDLHEGIEIVTTLAEHHSALVPLQELAKRKKLTLKHIPLDREGALDMRAAEEMINVKTRLVCLALVSNVTGQIHDVAQIARLAHAQGALLICDATAAVSHIPVNVELLGVDALYFSAHKMLGPTGVGVLYLSRVLGETLAPSIFGGDMVDTVSKDEATWAAMPTKFEAGTKNIGGIYGLGAAITYLNKFTIDDIHKHCATLAFAAIHKLEQIEGVKVYSPCDPVKNVGMVSFTADWAHPHDIAEVLARDNVAVRPGHHCAQPAHAALEIPSSVRASFHLYNNMADVDALVAAVKKAKEIFA